ncbi:Cytochrome b-c1 complex subunit 7 [Frankliniella fusca]|uniref:Cytochrome b-c1 complex subunit 7 n=1 Tax=Frankliniella fusca TaxID=407009 RepID=A0AAE1GVS5_9NEOP|nr:Cytochrome b-c1 complex subunit 7 [Frankliniella fusca]
MANEDDYWCIVSNLSDPYADFKIVEASSLFKIKDGNKCYPFTPKSSKFSRHEEFGIVMGPMLVKHVILSMSSDFDELESALKTKRISAPVRLSMTPTEIPVSEFTFPLQVKEQRKETSNLHEDTIRSRRDDDSKLLAAYKKIQQGIQEPNTLTIEKENKVIEEDDEFESLGNLDGDHQVNLEQHVDDEGPVLKKKSKRKRKSNKGGKKIKEKVDKKDKEKIVKEPPKIPHTVPENIEPIDQGEQIDKVTEIANSSGLSGSESDIPQAEWIEAKQNHNTRKNPISNAEDKGKEGHDSLAVELSSHDTTANKKNESETHNVSGNNRGHTSSKSTQTGFLECASCQRLKTDLEISQQRLQDAYDKVKSQQETIDKLQNRRCEEDSILERMKSLMSKSEGDRKSSGAKVSKSSKLDKLPSNLLSPKDKEEVDEKLSLTSPLPFRVG